MRQFDRLSPSQATALLEKPRLWIDQAARWLWQSPNDLLKICPGTISTEGDAPDSGPPLMVYYATHYDETVASLIRKAKYGPDWASARGISRLVSQLTHPPAWLISAKHHRPLIVPVPPDPKRLVQRGFHLPALIAKSLHHAWTLPAAMGLFFKTRHTPEQASLNREQRQRIAALDFRIQCRKPVELLPEIILVDDVMTTGSTLRAVAGAWRKAGGHVRGAVVMALVHPNHRATDKKISVTAAWHTDLWQRTEGIR